MMQFEVDAAENVVVLRLRGDVLGGAEGGRLHDELNRLKEGGTHAAVADLGDVGLMNSSGLGMLIGAMTTLRNVGGDLRLACVTPRVASLLAITKLTSVFKQYPTVEDAVASFSD
ncbi:hypothetical protein BH23BAC4_BH23BAC4_14810 [soil metagenome]